MKALLLVGSTQNNLLLSKLEFVFCHCLVLSFLRLYYFFSIFAVI